jgi:hypothetical protein
MRSTRQKASPWLVLILLAFAAAAMLFSTLGYARLSDAWDSWFGPRVNGSWKAIVLDRRSVEAGNYLVVVKRGKVVGGYDDCNGWSFDDEGPGPNGDRRVTSTLVMCPEDDVARQTYHILAYAPRIELLSDRELRMTRNGHVGLFRRCRPDRAAGRCSTS